MSRPGAKRPPSASPMRCWPASPATAASMCPRPGRSSTPAEIAGFAGQPYAEVAERGASAPFVGGEIDARRARRHGRRGLCELPPPGRRARWCRSATTSSCWSSSTARRSPSRTSRCSCSARLMDHVLDAARPARHHRRRDLGRHRRRGDRGVPGPASASTSSSSIPHGRVSRGAAPADDDGRRATTSMRSRSRAPSTTARRW